MLIAAILLGLCQFFSVILGGLLICHWFERKQAEIEGRINGELQKLVSGEPCQAGTVLGAVGHAVGSEAGRSAKAALMADLSHLSRSSNSQAQDEQLALASEANPVLGGALAGMGKRGAGKMLQNPFVQLALAFLANKGGNGAASVTPTSAGSVMDRLKKGQG